MFINLRLYRKPGLCLIHSVVGISIRIGFVLFAIPVMGIRGYLYGILLSELILTVLHVTALYRYLGDKNGSNPVTADNR